MRIVLKFDSVKEFGLFICSAAALDFESLPKVGVDLERCLPQEAYWPFLDRVSEIHVADVVYTVSADRAESRPVDCRVVNYMLNDVRLQDDSIWISVGDERMDGSRAVRAHLDKLPNSFSLRVGWRTDYLSYIFRRT